MKKTIAFGIVFLFVMMSFTSISGNQLSNQILKDSGRGSILYVGGNGPGNYTKIQDAINDASDSDTVFVYDDSAPYYEDIMIDKSINLIGEDRDTTIKWGECYISADWVNLSGFNIMYADNGIEISSNYNIISHNNISNEWCGLHLLNSVICNSILGNNIFSHVEYGIWLDSSNENTIIGNTITSNEIYGISVFNSHNNTISGNNISWTQNGIVVSSSHYNSFVDNYFEKNNHDLLLQWSNNSTVTGNTFSNTTCCTSIGIRNSSYNYIESNIIRNGGFYAINIVDNSFFNIITGNIISHIFASGREGIRIWYSSSYNTIMNNTISSIEYGINFEEFSNNNTIYHNTLINNTYNAYDECDNTWDDGYPSGGNFWDDYNGTDDDGDGIGDTPYPIPGGDNEDRYPLMEPIGLNLPVANFTIQNDSDIGVVYFDGSLSYDLDGDIVSYEWDYGDGTTDKSMYGWHQYCDCKTYYVTLTVTDNDGLIGKITKSVEIVLVNCPPPSVIIDGPNYGNPGVEYVYTFFVCDVFDETDYFLLVDWGDGNTTDWIEVPMLWEPVYLNHIWSEKGDYTIRAKGRDYCREGNWELFEVTIPREKATNNMLLLRILERFPLLQRLMDVWRFNSK